MPILRNPCAIFTWIRCEPNWSKARQKLISTLTVATARWWAMWPGIFRTQIMCCGCLVKKVNSARKAYRNYVKKGIDQSLRPELTGGCLVRSAGGWSAVKAIRRARDHMKSDERIPGGRWLCPVCVGGVKRAVWTKVSASGPGLWPGKCGQRVASLLNIDPKQVWASGKQRQTGKPRSLMCYWAVRKLGISATELFKKLGISQPSVRISVKRGEKIAQTEQFDLAED